MDLPAEEDSFVIEYHEKSFVNKPIYRVKAEDFKDAMHQSIVAIYISLGTKTTVGSGILISSDLILTAAHNVYNCE